MSTESKCPFNHTAPTTGATNRDWWPKQLKVELLHQHSSKSNPMGEDFNYAQEFKGLDLAAVVAGSSASRRSTVGRTTSASTRRAGCFGRSSRSTAARSRGPT